MDVLSLFDGLGGTYLALKQAGFSVDKYYASEIDKYSSNVAAKIPNYVNLGDIRTMEIPKDIDMVVFGSPCKQVSNVLMKANKGRGLVDGEESSLFFRAVEILREVKPKFFMMENVRMRSKEDIELVSKTLGVEPIIINSKSLSASQRLRYYWCNWNVKVPTGESEDKLVDLLEDKDVVLNYKLSDKELEFMNREIKNRGPRWNFKQYHDSGDSKSRCLVANLKKGVPYAVMVDRRFEDILYRKITPVECERLAGLPEGWTEFGADGKKISKTRRYEMIGNGFNIPTVTYLFTNI